MPYDKELEEAIARRDEFLEKNPQYKEMQAEIDRIIEATPEDKRLEVMYLLLAGKLEELNNALRDLARIKSLN